MNERNPPKRYKAKPTPGSQKKPVGKPIEPGSGEEGQRIAKLLARAGVASRREIERMIEAGRIKLNGDLVEHPSLKLKNLTGITVDDKPVAEPSPTKLFCFHKPTGYLTAERDFSGKKTIYDILPDDMERVMPIGRLDINTEGLLLMTTDGEFKRQMELPKNGIERTYRARTFGDITQNQLEELYKGITVDGMRYGPITANLERSTGRNQWIEMTLTEGKNREVRKVLEHFGLKTSRLIRTSYGPFGLGELAKGEIAPVRRHDLVKFRKTLD